MPLDVSHPPRPPVLGGRPLPVIGRARVYVCGITPYDVTHLGHAATFVWADTAVRMLRYLGLDTEVARNVTDVDDVLLAAARRAGTAYDRFAAVQQYRFDHDMAALGVRRPTHEPRAHRYVREVVGLAAALLDGGHAYLRDGWVYFRGSSVPARAGLDRNEALRLLAQSEAHASGPPPDDPLDVPVWVASHGDEPAWPSPWGPGRPGWHAECTAMAVSTLGPAVDLHVGGADLRFPHHAYEAAQAEAATGVRPFARTWMHVGTVHVDGRKMAKSTGNLVLVSDLLARSSAAAVRLLVLNRRWAEPWEYRPELLRACEGLAERLFAAAARPATDTGGHDEVLAALCDDLDVPRAVAAAEEAGGSAAHELLRVLGLS